MIKFGDSLKQNAAVAVVSLLAVYVVYKFVSGGVKKTAGDIVDAINPASDKNIINKGADSLTSAIAGEETSIGGILADKWQYQYSETNTPEQNAKAGQTNLAKVAQSLLPWPISYIPVGVDAAFNYFFGDDSATVKPDIKNDGEIPWSIKAPSTIPTISLGNDEEFNKWLAGDEYKKTFPYLN